MVPEKNRAALKWIFEYDENASPKIVIVEGNPAPGEEPQRWTFDE